MFDLSPFDGAHPAGESKILPLGAAEKILQTNRLAVDLHGRRMFVQWDPDAPVTPLGQLVYFCQFLATGGVFAEWVADCPVRYTSPNAPSLTNVLGTTTLANLGGSKHYSHVTALRNDSINASGLGMSRVVSEDSVRRAFIGEAPEPLEAWQRKHLIKSVGPVLREPWICDVDVTIKTLYGHQEGAEVGYNPHKPGRAAHAYHTFFVSPLRLALDVVVAPGKQSHSKAVAPNLWSWWEQLPAECRPHLMRFDCGFGNEDFLLGCEERNQKYLSRLRMTKRVERLIRNLCRSGGWQSCGKGWEGKEDKLRLSGWSKSRRVIVLRRRIEADKPKEPEVASAALPEVDPTKSLEMAAEAQPPVDVPKAAEVVPAGPMELNKAKEPKAVGPTQMEFVTMPNGESYEYVVLVTNTELEILSLARLYRERADSENAIGELKGQWGWGGFVTQDLLRCQVAARNVALIYNWWSLFVRCAEPQRPREAITSRPLLMYAVGRLVSHANQTTLILTSSHAQADKAQELLTDLSRFLSGLRTTAEQLTSADRWKRIWERILTPFRAMEAACRMLFGQEPKLTG